MKQVQKILFPIDFASNFESLVPWVETLRGKVRRHRVCRVCRPGSVEFLHFFRPPRQYPEFSGRGGRSARKKMAGTAQEFFKGFPKLETRVEIGSPAEKIVELAKKEKIDMIIMGAHGRKGLGSGHFRQCGRQSGVQRPLPGAYHPSLKRLSPSGAILQPLRFRPEGFLCQPRSQLP